MRRHDLVRLTADGWSQAMGQHDDPLVLRSLELWSTRDLPAVVATQGCDGPGDVGVVLGIPTPLAFGRRRVRLRIARIELRRGTAVFPHWHDCSGALPLVKSVRAALDVVLGDASLRARVYGSFGWQHLTGLAYVKESSDLDLLLEMRDVAQADQVATALSALSPARPRLDGEFCFDDGSAVAWREWSPWRAGLSASILVKRLDGPALVSDAAGLLDRAAMGVGT